MKHLMDFSTLRSVSVGLEGYGFYRYMAEHEDTQGLTQLLDIARFVDLVVLSDEIFVSERDADVEVPHEVADIVTYIPLNNDPSHFADVNLYAEDMENLEHKVSNVERLVGNRVAKDFVLELHNELTDRDRRFVEAIADKLQNVFTTAPKFRTDDQESQTFYSLVARTFQYSQTADLNSVPYVCHAYRSPIVRTFTPRLTETPFDLYRECDSKVKGWLIENYGNDRVEFKLPLFFLAVLKDTHSPNELLQVARQYRDSDEAVRIRQVMSEIRDENNQVNLLQYAALRRLANEETMCFQKKFSPQLDEEPESGISVEVSFSPTMITPAVSVDLLKLSKAAYRWLTEWKERRSVAVIFRLERKVYEVLSVESDLNRLWGVKLTHRQKNLLQEISQHCDT